MWRRSSVKDLRLEKSWLFESSRMLEGDKFKDSKARMVMTCASMIDPASMLSDVFLRCRPTTLPAFDRPVCAALASIICLGAPANAALVIDVLLRTEFRGVFPLEVCTMRTLSLLICLTEIDRARLPPFRPSGLDDFTCDAMLKPECRAGDCLYGDNAVMPPLRLLRPREALSVCAAIPGIGLLNLSPCALDSVCVMSPSGFSHSDPDDPSSKKSGPG